MADVKYSNEHEWIRVEGDVGTVGITDHAQNELGDIVYVDVPKRGTHVERGKSFAVVESVKAASEIFAPVSGEVIAGNDELATKPELVETMVSSTSFSNVTVTVVNAVGAQYRLPP